jgi:hypothetical protein
LLPDRQILTTTVCGYALTAFIGIWLSFSVKYVKKILANIGLRIHLGLHQGKFTNGQEPLLSADRQSTNYGTAGVETVAVATAGSSTTAQVIRPQDVLTKILGKEGGVRNLWEELFTNQDLDRKYWWRLFIFTLAVTFVSVGIIVAGVYSAKVRTDGAALLVSPRSGLWVFNRTAASKEATTRAGVLDLWKEERAGEYAQNCYATPDPFDSVKCDFLYRQRLPFGDAEYSWECPFHSNVCRGQSVTFKTNFIDASDLGINSAATPKFRRSTTCTPLNMDYPYIRNETHNGTTSFFYEYGSRNQDQYNPPLNYTHRTTGSPFDHLAPVYDVL